MEMKDIMIDTIEQMKMKPYDINNGNCDEFAQIICDRVEGAEIRATSIDDDFEGYRWVGHIWIEYQGRHYDAEHIEGAENFLDLPIFRRAEEVN
ncbi:hypothetical protein ACFL6S_37655 [Candidatus Poribacteria bacterium]